MSGNLLADSTSPYLIQHKDNPVHWRPWGNEALSEAKAANRPILLSVGYAACHWCHVMAHESFEDSETAALMNELFVNVKVDREERPDVDAIYMAALHMLGEQGGWPLTMFLTPDGEPFWGGTYFPPEPRWGRPSFKAVLREIARIYADDREMVDQNRGAIRRRLEEMTVHKPAETLSLADVDAAVDALLPSMDPVDGGLRGAPKFPNPGLLDLLIRAAIRRNDDGISQSVILALDRLCQGGIYDHLGGGFARYSVDSRWLVPHFEKMLYDNAQLIDLLTTSWQLTRNPLFAARISETISWLEREMRLPDGGLASSLDADSEGEEGRYYVWTAAEIIDLLGDKDAELLASVYDVSEAGNWEGRTILNRLSDNSSFSLAADERLAPMRMKLFAARAHRVRPGRDDKVLADWNGLAIAAIARAGAVFARPDWISLAEQQFSFISESMSDGDLLYHAWRNGTANIPGLASDYANMSAAAAALYEVTGQANYVAKAEAWCSVLDDRFIADSGGYHMTPADRDDLIIRPLSANDDATPAANAVIAETRLKLQCFTGNTEHGDAARRIFTGFATPARSQAFGHARLLAAAESETAAMEILVTGEINSASDALWQACWRTASPTATRQRIVDPGSLPASHAVHGKSTDAPFGYVCAGQTCSLPIDQPRDLVAEIERRRSH